MKYFSNCEISNQKIHTSQKLKQQQQHKMDRKKTQRQQHHEACANSATE